MLPYLLTIAALTVTVNRMRQPAALNKPFQTGGELNARRRISHRGRWPRDRPPPRRPMRLSFERREK